MTSKITDPQANPALSAAARTLLSASAVRKAGQRMLSLALDGRVHEWQVDFDAVAAAADYVARVVRDRYPRLDPPVHARWRHFVIDGHDLWSDIVAKTSWVDDAARARAAIDLVVISVLLDAGAGGDWRYTDRATGKIAARSEGLALASLRWFESGALSDNAVHDPLRVDATALRRVDAKAIGAAFQVTDDNPLLGLDGRASLLNRLGAVLETRAEMFAIVDSPRPGGLYDTLARRSVDGLLPATEILATLLDGLGAVWQNRPALAGVPLGDCWNHPAFAGPAPTDPYVPLHKLSQWLSYSLLEPLADAGVTVTHIDCLTGLAEYRNGGLLVDTGVLVPADADAMSRRYAVSDPFVVGWRSLTVALLDHIAPMVGDRLGMTREQFPLANVLEGGTWAAGRLIARDKRADGGPPFQILSDGTVF